MATGPEHYQAAEKLLKTATRTDGTIHEGQYTRAQLAELAGDLVQIEKGTMK